MRAHAARPLLLAGLGLAGLLLATGVQAQTPPPPVPAERGPVAGAPGGPPPPNGRRQADRERGPERGPERDRAPSRPLRGDDRSGHFRFERGDLRVEVKCPDEESLKACVDATMQLFDKFSTAR